MLDKNYCTEHNKFGVINGISILNNISLITVPIKHKKSCNISEIDVIFAYRRDMRRAGVAAD